MNKPKNYPDVVYKYRNWTKEYDKDVLLKNHLFLASPKSFNDPFDCRIPKNYKLLNTKEKIQKYTKETILSLSEHLVKEGRDIRYEREQLEYRLTNEIDQFQAKYEEGLFEMRDIHYGVLSLSCRWDSILMWSHYTDKHKGYCIGFWETKLRGSRKFGTGGPVDYFPDDDYPIIDPLERDEILNAFRETHHKAYEWKYEEEYRLTKLFFPEAPTDSVRTVKIPDDYFAEIVIGLETDPDDKKEIINIANKKDIKVFQAIKVPWKFKIDRVEIK